MAKVEEVRDTVKKAGRTNSDTENRWKLTGKDIGMKIQHN